MTALKSTASVRKAYDATASLATYWATAYADTASDIASGVTVRDIAAAWKSAGINPANKDSVGDMAEAHRLTAWGDVYAAAIADKMGEGATLAAHMLIGRARKARGIAYVRSVLTALENSADTGDEDNTDALAKAMRTAVRTLLAAKREPKPETGDEDTTGEATTDEATDETDEAATGDRTPDAMLAALAGPTVALRDMILAGEDYDEARMVAWLAAVSDIAKAHREAVKARAAA